MRLDILAWIIGVPLLIGAAVLIWVQYRQYLALKADLVQLAKVKSHSVEYDLVLKAMKLGIWRLDVPTRTISFESDYRDGGDSLTFPHGTRIDDVYDNILPEDLPKIEGGLDDLLSGRVDDVHVQYRIQIPHSERWYWSDGYATVDKRDLQGQPVSLVGTTMRIDQQKEIENALMEAVYHAEESDRLKSAFLANISHEIRTPLNAIVGFSDVLTMVDDEEERKKLVALVKQNNTHLLRLFDDIVSMSKLEARGGGALNKSHFQLLTLFKELQSKYEGKSKETGVPIVIENGEQLPTLNTDCDRLREILNQYLNNAMKFTTAGQVTLGCDVTNSQLRIWVRDTGKGIPADKCDDRLFERFFKVDEFVPGTGLGLSICRSLAMTMHGVVGVESELGKGSVFWIKLDIE